MKDTYLVSVVSPRTAKLRLVVPEFARLGKTGARVAILAALSFLLFQPRMGGPVERSADLNGGGDRLALTALVPDLVLVSKPSSGSGPGSFPADVPASTSHVLAALAALAVPWARTGFRARAAAQRVHARGPPAR